MDNLHALALQAAQNVDADEVVRLAQALVQIPSHYPGPGEAPVADYLQDYLQQHGFAVIRQEVAPGRPNLIADLGQGEGGLILEGHTDVVTPGPADQWSDPPYSGVVREGRLYGRGSCDMKGGLAAAIVAALAVKRVLGQPSRTLRLCIPCDEEGMMIGIKAFVQAGYAQGFAGAIIAEPEENEICLWQKGAMRVWVHFRGKMAHGAMPYAGANPNPAAACFVAGLMEVQAELQAQSQHPHLGLPWVTPTILEGSSGDGQLNVIPDRARVGIDIRTNPGQDHRAIEARLRSLLEASLLPGVSGQLEVFEDRPATETSPESPVAQAVAQARHLLELPVRYGGVPGATDGTFLWAWAHLPIVTIGPGGRTIPHQANEYVELEAMVESARTYAAAAVLLLAD